MGTSWLTAIYMLMISAKVTLSQTSCTPNPSPYRGPPIPKIPDSFSMDIVNTVFVTSSSLTSNKLDRLYVDAKRKLAVKVEGGDYNNGGKRTIYDGNRKEAMTIQGTNCNVTKFSDVSMDRYSVVNPTDFANGNDFFRFGEMYKPIFLSNFTVPGKKVAAWMECIPSLGGDEALNISVIYVFTNDTGKGLKFLAFELPKLGGQLIMNQIFNMVVGAPSLDMLNVPSDIFCKMSPTRYKLPKLPDEFEMNMEFVRPLNKTAMNFREFMDTKEKYFRSDHLHYEKATKKWFPVHEIHDFNTGISYEIDTRTYDCEMKPLINNTWDVAETNDHHHIRMRTTQEFFLRDHKDYIHEGYTNVRGMPADVFSTTFSGRKDPNRTILLKWYFSRPDWKVSGVEGPMNDTRVPVMAKRFDRGNTVLFNFYNYDPVEPTTHILWPIRACFRNDRHYMYFRLNKKFDTFGLNSQRDLTNAIRNALSRVGKISKLRVSSILIFKSSFSNGVIAVRVYVLGVPNVVGTVKILNPIHQTPLKDAVDKIRNAIKGSKFIVRFLHKSKGKAETVEMKAVKESYFDYATDPEPSEPNLNHGDKGSSGLSAGGVVAVTITMILLAVAATMAVLHFVLKRRGVQLFSYSRHRNDATA